MNFQDLNIIVSFSISLTIKFVIKNVYVEYLSKNRKIKVIWQ